MIVNVLQYLINTSSSKKRRLGFARMLGTWRVFRNQLVQQHTKTVRARDMDTDRENGMLIPTWQDLIMIGGHLLAKTRKRPEGTAPYSADVMEACMISLFVFFPAMRSAVWRTLQWQQGAHKDPKRQRYLDSRNVNYLFYDGQEETFTLRLNSNLKRKNAVVINIRRSEVPRVHDILAYYLYHHRMPLLRNTKDHLAGREFVFFHPSTGYPFDSASKMSKFVSSVVKGAAVELGLYDGKADNVKYLKCTPHVFRHALYEHIHSGDVPVHIRQSVAAACLHTMETADKIYGRVSQDRQSKLAREYVYTTAMQILDKGSPPSADTAHGRTRYVNHLIRTHILLPCVRGM